MFFFTPFLVSGVRRKSNFLLCEAPNCYMLLCTLQAWKPSPIYSTISIPSHRSGYNTPLSRATPPPPHPPLSIHPTSTSFSSFRPSPVPSSRPTSPPPLSNTDLEILREIVTVCENHLGRDVQPLAETLGIPFKVKSKKKTSSSKTDSGIKSDRLCWCS